MPWSSIALTGVVWAIADYGTMARADDGDADVREATRRARLHRNVVGVIMDVFFSVQEHWDKCPVHDLQAYKQYLNIQAGRRLDQWVVITTVPWDGD